MKDVNRKLNAQFQSHETQKFLSKHGLGKSPEGENLKLIVLYCLWKNYITKPQYEQVLISLICVCYTGVLFFFCSWLFAAWETFSDRPSTPQTDHWSIHRTQPTRWQQLALLEPSLTPGCRYTCHHAKEPSRLYVNLLQSAGLNRSPLPRIQRPLLSWILHSICSVTCYSIPHENIGFLSRSFTRSLRARSDFQQSTSSTSQRYSSVTQAVTHSAFHTVHSHICNSNRTTAEWIRLHFAIVSLLGICAPLGENPFSISLEYAQHLLGISKAP